MAKDESALDGLTPRQKRCVILFTDESKRGTYLNRVESYKACYQNKQTDSSLKSAAFRLFRKPNIQAAVKELLPTNAYDILFIRNEYMEHYEDAKQELNRKDCLLILDKMAQHQGMMNKKAEVVETTADMKKQQEMADRINSLEKRRNIRMMEINNGKESKQA